MNFINFKNLLKKFTVFSLQDIKMVIPDFYIQRLVEWQKKGYIKKIIRKYYIFSDLDIDENILFNISNKIYKPSYISFESAMSFYGFIPESVYSVTAVTTRKTYKFDTLTAKFSYHTLNKKLYFGYKTVNGKSGNFLIAEPEKAIIDYLYINTHIRKREDIEEMRFNSIPMREKIHKNILDEYTGRFGNKLLKERISILKGMIF